MPTSGTGTLTVDPPTVHHTSLTVAATTGHYTDMDALTARLMDTTFTVPVIGRLSIARLDGTVLGPGVTDSQGYARWTSRTNGRQAR